MLASEHCCYIFHYHYNITSPMYKGVCGRERGWVCGGGERAAGDALYPPLGVFGIALSPGSAIHRPIVPNMPRGPKRRLTTTRSISDPCLACGAIHGPHCLSSEITWPAKLALEKQTSQLNLCHCEWVKVRVQLFTGSIKWNRSSVTFLLVFQNPATYSKLVCMSFILMKRS